MKSPLTGQERDRRVLELYDRVLEIEERLIPTGLHVFGMVDEERAVADMLRMVASFNRPEAGVRALTDLAAESLGFADYSTLIKASITDEARLGERELIDALVRGAVEEFIKEGAEHAASFFETTARVPREESRACFRLLEKIHGQLKGNQEMESLVRALRGEYIEPGPGADIVQNPSILPTGRNTHAVNPYLVPSLVATARAESSANDLLERYLAEHGRYPRAMALVLWGLDNIKTEGEGVAQALWLLGVRAVRDRLNRATEIEVIPLEELGRPRIDVVMTARRLSCWIRRSGAWPSLTSPSS